jgi:hypothetical protein
MSYKEEIIIIDYPCIMNKSLLPTTKEKLIKHAEAMKKLKEIAFHLKVPMIINKEEIN